ncbi:minor tail protein [Gordonia phage Dogfish]|nr:minor tail protein [Gordonia phage Dogfish]
MTLSEIWRADQPPMTTPGTRQLHRFAEFFYDIPILEHGQPLHLTADSRDRLGRHCEAVGLLKAAPQQIKYWPPPRGHHQPGNTGFWVPINTPDPPEMTTPDPALMTAEERDFWRNELKRYEPQDYPGEQP